MKCPEHNVEYETVKTTYEQFGVILKDGGVCDARLMEKSSSPSNKPKRYTRELQR